MISLPQQNMLQNYQIIRLIGIFYIYSAAGTYAEVFEALDIHNNARVALKRMINH